jgi:hypothetical protein
MSSNHHVQPDTRLAERQSRNVRELQGKRLDFSRNLNLLDWDIPNRTKLVRLIVVPKDEGKICHDPVTANEFARARNATRADVFVVYHHDKWDAWSWVGTKEGLMPHHEAHLKHPETVVVLMVIDREQVQWECETHDFRIANIVKSDPIGLLKYTNEGVVAAPDSPFPEEISKSIGRRVTSGLPTLDANQCNQLYKVSFDVWLDGRENGPTRIDPDIYCDWS